MSGRRILPGATIGILGGGQLGRMMALRAREMGYRIAAMDANADSPCGQVADLEFVAPLDDLPTARKMASVSEVLTYEFENVSDEMVRILEQESNLPQGGQVLYITRHRIREKMALASIGVPVAPWKPIRSFHDLQKAVAELGLPCVLKTTSGGYDGKGQFVIRNKEEIEPAWEELGAAWSETGTELPTGSEPEFTEQAAPLVLEGWVPFEKELSVIAARNADGEVKTFPTAENIHRENILHLSIVPARIPSEADRMAQQLAAKIADELDVIGLIAVEMFWRDGRLLVNELAPRPHNSGHYTMDACVTSQFEQHVRAICNLPLGDTRLLSSVVMVNILGEHLQPVLDRVHRLTGGAKIHLYGKSEVQPKRKMGHLNVLADRVEDALQQIRDWGIWQV
ncbi:5-(carboxyamino)imidazole ribonucleotide synthase [Effusibacillus dendaii]|uniref:N5-carboxyaminoimidazole ribonucleotide synthase n=1 Tax=Effusibacillus dendaii TaxID=2743772 RepID=A0A7I8DAE6_9BACL|nr:5-(carboxyamino)imidazole ribonucleotide synthase [Effusibacillus dendaii]BCJ87158.1 N5-carboxyaminoimidazole ribonucleotide synthase [Effusibacillus dendaii]